VTGWKPLCDWFACFLERTLHPGPDGDALDAIADRVRRLSVLDTAGVPCDRVRFREAAERAIRGAKRSKPQRRISSAERPSRLPERISSRTAAGTRPGTSRLCTAAIRHS
jgi:hypothetical protein